MSKAVNKKWKKTFPDTIGNQNRPAEGVDDTQPFETGAFPQYMSNDPVRYDLQNAAMSQSMSNDARLKEMVDARGKELDDHKVDPGAHKAGIAGNAATATKVVTMAAAGNSANIAEARMANTDVARIRVSGADNAGELALETADNGNEAIVARQYTGTDNFKDVVRTAAILDANGNTSFPGTVVAPKFTGELNGNATTASKLASSRTLSLTGKASGSASFDGSDNAAINVTSVNADTASKLSSARKINITGNATGAAAFDGSGDISINTTVNESKHAAAANALNSMGNKTAIKDGTREPLNLSLYQVYNNGYPASYGNLLSIGGAGGGELLAEWSGGNKGIGHLYYRNRRNTSNLWSDWRTVAFTSDINSFAPTKTGGGASGTWGINISGNAATATKLATARAIILTGNASGSANFDGSGNVSINTTVSNSAAASVVQRVIQPRGLSAHDVYVFYGTLTIPQQGDFFKLEVLGGSGYNGSVDQSAEGTLYFRTGNGNPANYAAYSEYHRNGPKRLKFFIVKDSGTQYRIYSDKTNFTGAMQVLPYVNNESSFDLSLTTVSALPSDAVEVESRQLVYTDMVNNYAPTKTGGGASGTWGINITGNAKTATTASSVAWSGVTGKPGTYPPSAHNHDSAYPSVTGTRASGTWGISISGNADTVDGYHASDLLRTLGGNRTPVITDIFDRAGTIDMTTMSAADKAAHKANINKARNASQNIWNTDTGIAAYGGDYDMANGYRHGSLKLTQSYKNFDKILVVGSNDDANEFIPRLYDVWELIYLFSHSYRFLLFNDTGSYWELYGSVRTGADTGYSLSTDTVWNTQNQNGSIIAIYGIKY